MAFSRANPRTRDPPRRRNSPHGTGTKPAKPDRTDEPSCPMTSPRRPLFAGLLLSVLLLHHGVALAEANLPDLGDESSVVVSPNEERRLGEDFMRQARVHLDLVADPELNEYLRKLGGRLTIGAGLKEDFYFFLVNNPTINAFAVPSRFIGVHTGLLLTASSEAEVAAVLAHETAHITQRHIPRLIAESQRTSGPALAAILAGILIAASGGKGGEAAVALATASVAQNELNFTRAFEQEADRIGMKFLDTAGYDARAMASFFERLTTAGRLYEVNLPEFLRTHPVTTRRLAESRDHAENFPARKNPDDRDFRHMQARLRVLTNTPESALAYFRDRPDASSRNDPANRYGLALALSATHRPEAARLELQELIQRHPDYLPYLLLRAEIEYATGNPKAGAETYAAAAKRFPDSLAVAQKHAQALIKTGRYTEARTLLDATVRQFPDEPALYKLLATAAGESGQRMAAHRAFGEYYYRMGQPAAAIEQLELAIQHADRSFYYTSSIEARIREIREQSGLLFKPQAPKRPEQKK
jgi:predicted Zn-dependent protease